MSANYADILTALQCIPSEDRNVRLRVAAALAGALGQEGELDFFAWAEGSSSIGSLKNTWRWASRKASSISPATLYFLAREHGYSPERSFRPDFKALAEARARMEAERAESNKRRRQDEEAVAKKANGERDNPVTGHVYLNRKGIPVAIANRVGCRQKGNNLLVPAYDAASLLDGSPLLKDWQCIREDGKKLFTRHGTGAAGKAMAITSPDSRVFSVCEGFATGVAHHLRTGDNVIVAFNDSNSVYVTKLLREKFPEVVIHYIADNDASGAGQRAADQVRPFVDKIIMSKVIGNDAADDLAALGL